LFSAAAFRAIGQETYATIDKGMSIMPQSAIARGFLAQFSPARQAGEMRTFAFAAIIENAMEKQRDRLPLLAPVGLGSGIILWQLAGSAVWPTILCAAAGFILIALWLGLQQRAGRLIFWAAMLMCIGFGAIALKSYTVSNAPLGEMWIGTLNASVESIEDISARELVRYTLVVGQHKELPDRVRVNVPLLKHDSDIRPGDIVQMKVRLMPPPGPALPRSYDFARQAWFSGLGATGSALSKPVRLSKSSGDQAYWSEQREGLAAHIRDAMPAGSGAIGAALLVGSRGAIGEEDAEALRNSGMAHLLSVSGLHVTAVVGGTFILMSRLLALFPFIALRFRVPVLAAAGSAIVAVYYTLLTGAEVPTVRACVAALLILTALAMGREALSLRLLATGACFVLVFWPEALAGPSFQLSFAAVATIIVLHESQWLQRLTGRREEILPLRFGRFVLSLLLTGLAIELVLAPIALFHFHKSGLYGAVANIFAIPLTTFFIMPLQILGLIFDAIGLGQPFWWLAGQGVFVIVWLAHWVSAAPGSVLALPSMPRWAFGACVLGGLWLAIFIGRLRLIGILPIFAGLVGMAFAPRPDILVTGDGRHLAVIDNDEELVMLRPRAGDYALSMLGENAAIKSEPKSIDDWPDAQCTADMCSFTIKRGDRNWVILASRSNYMVPSMALASACKRADIVISERYLPWSCKPRWFKADRDFLERQGGLAIYLNNARVDTVAQTTVHQPWSQLGPKRAPKRPSGKADAKHH
jgi:competence protein ComEC